MDTAAETVVRNPDQRRRVSLRVAVDRMKQLKCGKARQVTFRKAQRDDYAMLTDGPRATSERLATAKETRLTDVACVQRKENRRSDAWTWTNPTETPLKFQSLQNAAMNNWNFRRTDIVY